MSMTQTSQTEVDDGNYESFLGLLQADESGSDDNFATDKDFQTLHEARACPWRDLTQNII